MAIRSSEEASCGDGTIKYLDCGSGHLRYGSDRTA